MLLEKIRLDKVIVVAAAAIFESHSPPLSTLEDLSLSLSLSLSLC